MTGTVLMESFFYAFTRYMFLSNDNTKSVLGIKLYFILKANTIDEAIPYVLNSSWSIDFIAKRFPRFFDAKISAC